ncbi:NADP-dependent oxidoreductase domain containing protein, partial [Rhypophila decipiens]
MARPAARDQPPTELGRLRILSSTAGIRVSPLALGGGSIGRKWANNYGYMDKEGAFKLLDAYYEAGGNFIDTANAYQAEKSETWIGEWISLCRNRDNLVLATKYSIDYRLHSLSTSEKGRTANHGGNHRRSLHMSIRDSLKKLQTDYIDILYLHWWDYQSSVEEVMDSLDTLVKQGKVLYLGISDTPAWIVSMCNVYARDKGKTQFSVYSGRWSVMCRDFEREILPMCRFFGMALVPWGVLGGGKFQSKEDLEKKEKEGESLRGPAALGQGKKPLLTEVQRVVSEALEKVAKEEKKTGVTEVALAYVLHKAAQWGVYNVFPVIGGRKVEQFEANIRALGIELADEQMKYLESVKPFEIGFPHDFIGGDPNVVGEVTNRFGNNAYLAFPGA